MGVEDLSAEDLLEDLRTVPKENAIEMDDDPQRNVSISDDTSDGYKPVGSLTTSVNVKRRDGISENKARILKLCGMDQIKVAIAEGFCKVFYFTDKTVQAEEGSKVRQLIKAVIGDINALKGDKKLFRKVISKTRDRFHTGWEEFLHQWGQDIHDHLCMEDISNDIATCMLHRAFGNSVDLEESILWGRTLCFWYIQAFKENSNVERKLRRNIDKTLLLIIAEAHGPNLDTHGQASIKPCPTNVPVVSLFVGHRRKTFAIR